MNTDTNAALIKKQKRNTNIKKHVFCYTLLSVTIVHWVIFWLIVNLQSLVLPFQDAVTGAFTLDNFTYVLRLMSADSALTTAFKNTFFIIFKDC